MEKTKKFLSIFFFLLFVIFPCNIKSDKFSNAASIIVKENLDFNIKAENHNFTFCSKELLRNVVLSKNQEKILKSENNRINLLSKILGTGVSKTEAIFYLFPEIKEICSLLDKNFSEKAEDNKIKVYKNECKILFCEGKKGKYIDKLELIDLFFKEINNSSKIVNFEISAKTYNSKNITEKDFKEKSCFSTNFEKSSIERKNNIKTAMAAFDGIVLEEGEILSFNKTTGIRNEENGYKKAKIISAGTFVDAFGGGVCQVSTTLYNACLLAGLEIIEVNSHSLPVSYVEPSFDAMVNSGSSDLVIRNNTNGKIVITSSSNNDRCKFKIFGTENNYKITRISEKTKLIKSAEEKIETDYKKYGLENLEIGEEKRLSYAKDGFYSNGYLNYYDKKGNLIETKKIRESKYFPTIGVIVRREN